MNTGTDLKALERKAYLSYHNDGLLDAGVGLIFLMFGIGIVFDVPWLAGVFAALGISSYAGLKAAITMPRVGLVRFNPKRRRREKKQYRFFLVFFTATFLMGMAGWFGITGGGDALNGIRSVLEKFPFGLFGIINAVVLGALGYWQQVNRSMLTRVSWLFRCLVGRCLTFPCRSILAQPVSS